MRNIIPGNKQSNDFLQSINEIGIEITDKKEIAETFKRFFVTVGSKLAEVFNFDDTSYINPTLNQNSFNFSRVTIS